MNKSTNTPQKFIATFNPETSALLSRMGFKQIKKADNTNNYYVFLNEPNKVMFEKLDDVVYTNTLFF